MFDGGWLFPGLNPVESLIARQFSRAIHGAADAAQIDKRVSMNALRHYSESRTMPRQVGCALEGKQISM
ncbi:hypothetical protein [Aromatoleum diolicum]|uniref:hypothetical protein n=1 Tax=Aromatoleum diolicum TaxID=75796 RepID=UPI001B7D1DE3|nr:hypothetical protein [Aromatoleum diolicum]